MDEVSRERRGERGTVDSGPATGKGDAFAEVSRFGTELYACLTARGDALFELCDAQSGRLKH
ncbi:hypothetical protein SY2F82_74880 [Streptomyces sp. Y2F8-2]|nr:hypothetical protein SY2F82_74880 [Streptomyces sp. Y2F8-2]